MKNPYSCPICNAKETSFFQYPMICGSCWTVLKEYDVTQLQMKLTFWSAMKINTPVSKIG